MWDYRDLFLLGVAFLLLETKNVTGFALYFGTTWLVNALVFAGVLIAVLAAVEVTRRFRTPPLPLMYLVLLGGLLLAWLVPTSCVLSLPVVCGSWSRWYWLSSRSWPRTSSLRSASPTAHPATAFGTNLLGAMVGGCLEYAALAIGYRWLLIICALLYLAAYLITPREPEQASRQGTDPLNVTAG